MPNRDLIVVGKSWDFNEIQLKKELNHLNKVLYSIENLASLCNAHEVIDINRYKIIKKNYLIEQYFSDRKHKPFVFIINKN